MFAIRSFLVPATPYRRRQLQRLGNSCPIPFGPVSLTREVMGGALKGGYSRMFTVMHGLAAPAAYSSIPSSNLSRASAYRVDLSAPVETNTPFSTRLARSRVAVAREALVMVI